MGSAYQVQTGIFDDPSNAECNEPGITYLDGFIHNHRELFAAFETNLKWNCQFQSRKTVTFGVSYNYRNGRVKKKPMPDFLEPILQRIHDRFAYLPNNCLVNYYPTGDNYISFHSDQDTEMKADTGVAIISLGSVRTMTLRSIANKKIQFHYPLQPGSAFFMEDRIQSSWQHGVLRESGAGPRISMSFRSLIN